MQSSTRLVFARILLLFYLIFDSALHSVGVPIYLHKKAVEKTR